jgi:3-hydroxyisobutyryl-CoA hydrolase
MVRQFLSTPDFLEGVGAKLIEKREPVWSPTLQESSILTPSVIDEKFFGKKPDTPDLKLYNKFTYYDYPHRTLSGLPTDRDIRRVVAGNCF